MCNGKCYNDFSSLLFFGNLLTLQIMKLKEIVGDRKGAEVTQPF